MTVPKYFYKKEQQNHINCNYKRHNNMVTKWNDANEAGEYLLLQIKTGRYKMHPQKNTYNQLKGPTQIFDGYSWSQVKRAWEKYAVLVKEQKGAVAAGKVDCFFLIILLFFVGKRTICACVFFNTQVSGTNPFVAATNMLSVLVSYIVANRTCIVHRISYIVHRTRNLLFVCMSLYLYSVHVLRW
jgi:hypothetical protein